MDSQTHTVVIKSLVLRRLVFSIGCLSTLLGFIGAFLPLLPTTPFLILAAWCFIRSSEKAHQWLLTRPVLGKALQDWENHRAISLKSKTLALSMMTLSAVWMWWKVDNLYVLGFVSTILLSVAVFIISRPSR